MDAAVRASLPSSRGVAVVGLGSYARSELCPASDVDLLLLHDGWRRGDLEQLVRAICYPLWDAGLALGYAVRTPREAVQAAVDRLETATALTDRRLVVGDPGLADELGSRYGRWVRGHGAGLLRRLAAADAERHVRAGDRPGMLEPDLKRGAGGLRDLESLRWAAACALAQHGLEPLVDARYLGPPDLPLLRAAAATLLRVRCALHLHLGRTTPGTSADVLTLEVQDAVAALADMGDGEALLRAVNLAGRDVAHLHERVWARILADAAGGRGRRPPAQRLADGIVLDHQLVEIEPGRTLATDPGLGMRAVAAAAAQGRHLGRQSSSTLARDLARLRSVPWTAESRAGLVATLRRGRHALPALADADRIGLLDRMLPDWQRVRGKPQRNPFHRYDLDTHLVQSIAELGEVAAGAYDTRHAALWERLDEPDVVLLATWLHDVGKAYPGDHAVVGATVAREWLLRMGFDGRRADRVGQLVRLHLLLPDTATTRDLDDEDEIASVAEQVGDVATLDGLYLLSVADSRATGPSAHSPWRDGLLAELHARVRTRLSADPQQTRALTGPAAVLADARGLAEDLDVDGMVVGLPRRYLLAADAEQVAAHARLLASGEAAAFREGRAAGTQVVSLAAPDRRGLMADAAGVLAGYGLRVLEARAFTRGDRTAFDWFVVTGQTSSEADVIVAALGRVVGGDVDVARLVADQEVLRARSGTPRRPVPVEVVFDRGPLHTRVEVRGPDAPGVLYRLGRVLADEGLDVLGARVATLGDEVRDVFFVRPSGGPPDTVRLTERLRAAAGWPE